MVVKINQIDRDTLKRSLMVTYRLKDGAAAVGEWKKGNEIFRADIENHGVATSNGVFFPKDGQKFLNALELGLANSSQIEVVKLDS